MTPTDRYHMLEHRREPTPRIVLRHVAGSGHEPIILDAACLLAQYAVSHTDTLLVLDEDTLCEEQLHLVLLRDDRVLDHIDIGAPYATGAFRPAEMSVGTLRFHFENDAIWTLAVDAHGGRGIGCLPSGARRRTGLLAPRWMTLERLPTPFVPLC